MIELSPGCPWVSSALSVPVDLVPPPRRSPCCVRMLPLFKAPRPVLPLPIGAWNANTSRHDGEGGRGGGLTLQRLRTSPKAKHSLPFSSLPSPPFTPRLRVPQATSPPVVRQHFGLGSCGPSASLWSQQPAVWRHNIQTAKYEEADGAPRRQTLNCLDDTCQ